MSWVDKLFTLINTRFYTKDESNNKYADKIHTHTEYLTSHQDISGKANTADLATVATTGDYNDLINAPQDSGAINDEDLYLKAQFKCVQGPYTITTTKKSFVLDSTHNDIVETIYFNEPITYQYNEGDIGSIYDWFDVVYREVDPETFSYLNIADDIDVVFASLEQE